MDEKRHILLVHADRGAEVRSVKAEPVYFAAPRERASSDAVLYSDVGKVYVVTSTGEDGEALEASYVRMYVHPDLIEQIKERGKHYKMEQPV